MIKIVKLGSFYLDGKETTPNAKYGGERLLLGDTIQGNELSFVKWNNLLVSTQIICTNIGWEQLDKMGFIFGCPIMIDGAKYLVRSPRAGASTNEPNEWDSILDEFGDEDDLWHWKDNYFWGQDYMEGTPDIHVLRGCESARKWRAIRSSSLHEPQAGFRPILAPQTPEPIISDKLIGSKMQIYGPSGKVSGCLDSYTDYDLVISPSANRELASAQAWTVRDGNKLVVNREAILWIR